MLSDQEYHLRFNNLVTFILVYLKDETAFQDIQFDLIEHSGILKDVKYLVTDSFSVVIEKEWMEKRM